MLVLKIISKLYKVVNGFLNIANWSRGNKLYKWKKETKLKYIRLKIDKLISFKDQFILDSITYI